VWSKLSSEAIRRGSRARSISARSTCTLYARATASRISTSLRRTSSPTLPSTCACLLAAASHRSIISSMRISRCRTAPRKVAARVRRQRRCRQHERSRCRSHRHGAQRPRDRERVAELRVRVTVVAIVARRSTRRCLTSSGDLAQRQCTPDRQGARGHAGDHRGAQQVRQHRQGAQARHGADALPARSPKDRVVNNDTDHDHDDDDDASSLPAYPIYRSRDYCMNE